MVKDCRIQGYNFVSHWFALGVLQAIADPATQSPRPAPGGSSTKRTSWTRHARRIMRDGRFWAAGLAALAALATATAASISAATATAAAASVAATTRAVETWRVPP